MGEVIVIIEDVTHILGLPINGEPVTGRTDNSHQFLVENCLTCFDQLPDTDDHVLGKESIERYVRAHIFFVLRTVLFPNKSTNSLNSKFLPLLRYFSLHFTIQLGAASLAHLYRSLCHASPYNCNEMDNPLVFLFVWAWERMLFLTPISRNELTDVGVLLARRWSHWHRLTRYTQKSTAHFRQQLDEMEVNEVVYYEWYTQQHKNHLRLSDRVAGAEADMNEP
ncbi:hypothetical protein Ahy_A07g036869 [Arachis hypogaea]|uniref:Aminotransferase-like plant mobile domain-containing protein n=1 Tax=Arachis hypogaea TaxID=3818 RepID=A0A445CH54_ARAHY|nr:hypothetical protein Ahy_A07g036869 [Arachis hypogaea]